jgi:hypothetical protein
MPSLILANEHSKLQVQGDSQVRGPQVTITNVKMTTNAATIGLPPATAKRVVFCAVRVAWKESRRFVLPRTSC